jgi:hypothetical protein
MAASVNNEMLLDQCVTEAMLFDIQPTLGAAFFHSLTEAFDSDELTTIQTTLLDGGAYTYNERSYYFQGIRTTLCYYAFSRYVKRDGIHHTATGMVTKDGAFSEAVSDKTRQRLSGDDHALAEGLKLEIIDFLNRNSASFPLWCCVVKKRKPQIRAIGQ